MAISTRMSRNPVTPSAQSPSTGARPSSSRPSSVKNSMAAPMSSTTMPTLSIRLTVTMSPWRLTPRSAARGEQREPPVRWSVRLDGARSLDHLIRPRQHCGRDRQPELTGGLEVDDQLELARLLDRQVGGLRALEDLVHEGRRAALQIEIVCPINHETVSLYVLRYPMHRRQARLRGTVCDLFAQIQAEDGVIEDHERVRSFPGHRSEGAVELLRAPRLQDLKPYPQVPGRHLRLSQLGYAPRIVGIPE